MSKSWTEKFIQIPNATAHLVINGYFYVILGINKDTRTWLNFFIRQKKCIAIKAIIDKERLIFRLLQTSLALTGSKHYQKLRPLNQSIETLFLTGTLKVLIKWTSFPCDFVT